ncbi:MAG TPA: hypothetical protein VHC47_01120 [Mucilaginibacter sp.]|nr:hypothetical protein [Mucilaginibacter sp.]
MDREIFHLKDVDAADISDVVVKVERSFNVKLNNEDLKSVATFTELCDTIKNKITIEHQETCSTQHAFYLIRNAIASNTGRDRCGITPHTKLSELFPRENRIRMIEEIEDEIGVSTKLLQPKKWVLTLFSLILLASFAALFFNWILGAAGILASALGLKLAGKFGKEIHLKTVGDLANRISRESYLKMRRAPNTVNKNEVEQKVKELFVHDLGLEPVMVKRDSHF